MVNIPKTAAEYRAAFEAGNVKRFLDVYWENFRANWPAIKPLNGVRQWSYMRKEKRRLPVVVAAAGPSLENALPLLAAYKDRFLLITVDAARDRVMGFGARPHVTVTADPQPMAAQFFKNYERGQLVVACAWQHPDLFRTIRPQDTVVFTERLSPEHQVYKLFWKEVENKWLPDPGWFGRLVTASCVGNTAVALAYWMGATEVIIVGMDLCWKAEGIEWVVGEEYISYELLDMNGTPVKTGVQYHQALLLLQEACAKAPGCRFINATGAGLLYGSKGIEVMPLEAALEQCAGPAVKWEYQLRKRMKAV